jgi:6-pyruvoyl-tetrahydropterin synthase|uniref:Uncharacterized protein n=1 Tax=Picea glauca TaxID=3330 RepID=A0A101M2X9_PICGL|nr:hypothetical protein ABT39_MTgene3278 [Picea glauca]QHR89213.1 hypothetical protein Q903MT_gene3233 [Picea sitchensis]
MIATSRGNNSTKATWSYFITVNIRGTLLEMHWLGPFMVVDIQDLGDVKIAQLDGTLQEEWVNGAFLKPFTPPAI